MIMEKMKNLVVEEEGQGMVEYGLIIGLISVVALVALTGIGTQVKDVFGKIQTSLTGLGG